MSTTPPAEADAAVSRAVPDEPASAERPSPIERPTPLRFGLRGMFLVMAMCGAQFALVARMGVLVGCAAGLAICLAVVTGLLAAGIYRACRLGLGKSDKLDALAIRAVVGVTVLFNAMMLSGGAAVVYREYAALQLARRVADDLGFSFLTLPVVKNSRVVRAIRVTGIEPGGEFDRAGVQVGDVIDAQLSPNEYFAMLDRNRGSEVDVTLAAGADLQPLEKCSRRTVTIVAPKRR